MARDMMLLLVVRLELAEYLRGRFELLWREALVTDDQHVMADESLVQGLAVLRVNRLPEMGGERWGRGMIGQGGNGEGCHRLHSHNLKGRLAPGHYRIKPLSMF